MKSFSLSYLVIIALALNTNSFAQKSKSEKKPAKEESQPAVEQLVVVKTEYGDIKLKLYNETPRHRDNFATLAKQGFYDSTLFHRVISNFMIQGGDPTSKNAKPDAMLGNGENGYTVPAEFNPNFYHKKGALAGARQSDNVNPMKASSGCQFYIVQGKVFSSAELDQMEMQINMSRKQQLFSSLIQLPTNKVAYDSLVYYQQNKQQALFQTLIKKFEPIIETEFAKSGRVFKFSEQARKDYTTIGGAPHLDGDYTVFGETIEGLDVIDKIAAVEKNPGDRPKKDVIMTVKLVEK